MLFQTLMAHQLFLFATFYSNHQHPFYPYNGLAIYLLDLDSGPSRRKIPRWMKQDLEIDFTSLLAILQKQPPLICGQCMFVWFSVLMFVCQLLKHLFHLKTIHPDF